MKRLSLTLALVLLVFASLSFAQDSTTGIVRGQVLDTTSQRNPVAGVEVIIVGTGGEQETATTDEVGSLFPRIWFCLLTTKHKLKTLSLT